MILDATGETSYQIESIFLFLLLIIYSRLLFSQGKLSLSSKKIKIYSKLYAIKRNKNKVDSIQLLVDSAYISIFSKINWLIGHYISNERRTTLWHLKKYFNRSKPQQAVGGQSDFHAPVVLHKKHTYGRFKNSSEDIFFIKNL